MRTTISSKGQVVLPAELRAQDRILAGQQFEVERLASGQYVLRRTATPATGLVEWLRACPEQGWFRDLPSESTDTL